jgi:K(+)-stimulated pyrophosphate-energized sodium pump
VKYKGLAKGAGVLAGIGILAAAAIAEESVSAAAAVENITAGSSTPGWWWVAPVSSVAALIFAYIFYKGMMGSQKGNETMEAIASYVREGAYAYLFRQYRVVAVIFIILSAIFAAMAYFGIQNPFVPMAFHGLCW